MEITIIESSLFSNFTKLFLCMLGIKIVSKSIFWFFWSAPLTKTRPEDSGYEIASKLSRCLRSFWSAPEHHQPKKLNLEKGHL